MIKNVWKWKLCSNKNKALVILKWKWNIGQFNYSGGGSCYSTSFFIQHTIDCGIEERKSNREREYI